MKTRTIVLATAVALGFSGAALAGDAAAGKTKAEPCSKCHEPADFAGKSAADIEALIKDIGAGKVKHKNKLALSDADIKDIAAYFASGK
jgi:cytochrome c553